MKKDIFLRIVFYAAGLLILALGIILNTKSGLGVSPIISVAYSIATIGGFNFGNITFLLYSAFVVVEIVLHIFRNQRYSREADGTIAPAAHRDLKLVLLMDLLQLPLSLVFTRFMNLFSCSAASSVRQYVIQASDPCRRNHPYRYRCRNVSEHAYHPQSGRRDCTGYFRLCWKICWLHQELL